MEGTEGLRKLNQRLLTKIFVQFHYLIEKIEYKVVLDQAIDCECGRQDHQRPQKNQEHLFCESLGVTYPITLEKVTQHCKPDDDITDRSRNLGVVVTCLEMAYLYAYHIDMVC